MRTGWTVMLAAALGVAACGGSGKVTTGSAASPTTTARSTTSSPSTTAAGSSTDCNTLGINPTGMREGSCTHGGITYTIVDENHTLKLQTLWAKLNDVRSAKSVSGAVNAVGGRFVVASITITDKLPAPQTFDKAHTQQAGLILGGGLFKEDVAAETADPSSCLNLGRAAIQPDRSITCDVIFVVPAAAAAELGKHGSGDLYLVDFGSDLAASIPPQTIGQIRLYR